jgi:hypothetical protein
MANSVEGIHGHPTRQIGEGVGLKRIEVNNTGTGLCDLNLVSTEAEEEHQELVVGSKGVG